MPDPSGEHHDPFGLIIGTINDRMREMRQDMKDQHTETREEIKGVHNRMDGFGERLAVLETKIDEASTSRMEASKAKKDDSDPYFNSALSKKRTLGSILSSPYLPWAALVVTIALFSIITISLATGKPWYFFTPNIGEHP